MSSGVDCEELERLRAENESLRAALSSEQERFRLLFDAAPVAIGVFSFQEARFLDVNQHYLELFDQTREEFFSNDPYEMWIKITHPDDLEVERRELMRMVEGQIDGYEMRKRYLRNGVYRWAHYATHSLRDERGRLSIAVLNFLDIHDQLAAVEARERLEERLREAQKLETIGRLVGGVAHDFNNRLLVIMGYAELLKRAALGDFELESHADVVLTSARRAAELTRQLLAYGRRQVLRPRACDLNALVDRMRRMLERVIGESVELVTVLGAKQQMLADPGQIEQVLMNLVLNARDAMSGGGRITIETTDAQLADGTVGELPAGAYVMLSVTDTGPGVPAEMRSKIFEPFFTTKDVGKGTGLGLAMVEGIVRQSGGAVSIRSAEGRGATFTVYLPRAVDARPDTPVPADPVAELQCVETVLVVDDEDDVRRLLVEVLGFAAYRVLEARDGEHALEVYEQHGAPIDLLVTDVVMPKMKGTELAERLRARQPGLLTLYLSGYAERDSLKSLRPDEHFMAKPFPASDIYRVVRSVLAAGGGERAGRTGQSSAG